MARCLDTEVIDRDYLERMISFCGIPLRTDWEKMSEDERAAKKLQVEGRLALWYSAKEEIHG